MGTPHRVYSLRGLVHPSHRQHMLVGTVCVISIVDPCSFLVSFSPAVFSQHSSPPQLMSQKDQSHLLLLLISLFEPELHYCPVCTLMVEWILLRCIISHRVKTPPRRSYLDKSNPMSRSVDKCSNAVLPKECLVTILWLSHWRCHHILEGSQLIS